MGRRAHWWCCWSGFTIPHRSSCSALNSHTPMRAGEDRAFRYKPDIGAADAARGPSMLLRMGCVLAILALFGNFKSAAQVAQFEGKRIADIQYLPAQILDPADLASAQPLKKGDVLSA